MVDKVVLHNAGQSIIEADEDIQQQWPDYKRLGGTAKSSQSIPRNLANPCAEEEAAVELARQAPYP